MRTARFVHTVRLETRVKYLELGENWVLVGAVGFGIRAWYWHTVNERGQVNLVWQFGYV